MVLVHNVDKALPLNTNILLSLAFQSQWDRRRQAVVVLALRSRRKLHNSSSKLRNNSSSKLRNNNTRAQHARQFCSGMRSNSAGSVAPVNSMSDSL